MTSEELKREPEPLTSVRVGFVLRGTTFSAWCRANGVNPSNARMALRGGWRGPKAQKLVKRIKKAAGVQ